MPTPNFEDAPDGSSSINHTGEAFWTEISTDGDEVLVRRQPAPPPQPPVNFEITENPFTPPPPHPSYADGSAPLMPPQMTATQVNEARRRVNPEWRPARSPDAIDAVPPNPVGYSRDFPPPCSPPRQPPRRTATEELRDALSIPRGLRRGDGRSEVVKKDPNAWSLREAVELCKLLEVVLPEAGFHIALTGGLLYKEGRRKDCDLMFYQIRQVEPNYEVLWKYLTVAGVIRSPSYPENGWLVKATYRGKLIDCLFPNAKKVKKAGAPNPDCYKAAPVLWDAAQTASTPAPIIYHRIPDDLEEFLASNDPAPVAPASRRESERIAAAIAADLGIASGIPAVERVTEAQRPIIPILYRRLATPLRIPPAELLATTDPAPVPAAAEAQDDIPF